MPSCRKDLFSVLYWEMLLKESPLAICVAAGAYVAVSINNNKLMPNQFSKKLVALPFAGFLSLPGFLIGTYLNSKIKTHGVFSLETFSLCCWFVTVPVSGQWRRGVLFRELCFTVFRSLECLPLPPGGPMVGMLYRT